MPKSYRQLFLEQRLKDEPIYDDLYGKFDPKAPEYGRQDLTTQTGIRRSNDILSQPSYFVNPDANAVGYRTASTQQNATDGFDPITPDEYKVTIINAAQKTGVSTSILSSLLAHESSFDPDVVSGKRKSSAGAAGIAQFMPATARALGVDPLNVQSAIEGAARYLKQNFDRFGSWDLALAAYNAGEGNVSKYGGIPPFKETQNYVQDILYKRTPQAKGNIATSPRLGGFESAVERFMNAITPTAYASEGQPSTLPKGSEVMSGSQYTVKKNDTLWDIANKYLGSGQRWKELIGYSGDPRKMPIGTKITIPTAQPSRPSPTPENPIAKYFQPNTVGGYAVNPPAPKEVSKYFQPNTVGGFKVPESQPAPQPIPAPTPAYFAKYTNPIEKYFQPNTVGGFSINKRGGFSTTYG